MNLKRIILFGIISSVILAQDPITVSNVSGVSADYDNLRTALSAAPENSTIYVYASTESYGNIDIVKKVTLLGAGMYSDSPSPVRSRVGTVNFTTSQSDSSHGSTLIGFETASISVFTGLRNITIARNTGSTITLSQNLDISIINNRLIHNSSGIMISLNGSTNTTILNNHISKDIDSYSADGIFDGGNALVANNYVYFRDQDSNGSENMFSGSNYVVENNIFHLSNYAIWGYITSSQITNNLSQQEPPIGQNFNSGYENIIGSALFTSTTFGNLDYYKLAFGSLGIEAGTDGTDLGIHGGAIGFEDAYMPPLPYVYRLLVPASVPQNGTITVEIIGKSHN